MHKVAFKGSAVDVAGEFPALGAMAPDFKLAAGDLTDKSLSDFRGRIKILNIVPSLDTPVCAVSARKFNAEIADRSNAVLLNISADLPFAQGRFCESNRLDNIVTLSTFRAPGFGDDYGVRIISGPLAGLMARAVLVLDADGKVLYGELVPEISREPDYQSALKALP